MLWALALAWAGALAAEAVYEPNRGYDPDVALGVGHVRPQHEGERHAWLEQLAMPVLEAPGGRPLPLPTRRMSAAVETGYETASIVVLEARADGWLRLPFGWVHRSGLENSKPALEYEPWERLFASGTISPLYFRSQVRHALRAAASGRAPLVAWIPADRDRYAIEPLGFEGDWARVRVSIPSNFCAGPEAKKPETREGWIRWRDPLRGPWLWYYTRGC